MPDFPPGREGDLITFSANFDAKITATPTAFGLTAPQATVYAALHTAFVNAHAVANDPLTRSPANVASKDDAKANLLFSLRQLAGIVQRYPGTTNPKRIELGLPTRNAEPTPIPAPAVAPLIEVKRVVNRTARIRLIDTQNPTRRGKPPGTIGASVFSHVGTTPPAALADWTFEGNTGRTTVDVVFPATVAAGATVWLTAAWFNPRKQPGPTSDPISANLPGGAVSALAA